MLKKQQTVFKMVEEVENQKSWYSLNRHILADVTFWEKKSVSQSQCEAVSGNNYYTNQILSKKKKVLVWQNSFSGRKASSSNNFEGTG